MLGHVPPRIRLDGARTAIRPLAVGDAAEFAAAVIANRRHTEPWEPIHAEAHYTRAGQAETLRRDVEAWDLGTGYAFAVLDREARDAIIGRIALGNVVRGAWRNATLGYWVSEASGGRGHGTAARSARAVSGPSRRVARVAPAQRIASGRASMCPPYVHEALSGPRRAPPSPPASGRRCRGPPTCRRC